ncbi:MAG: PLDc N-terminal domain-containing protein [Bacteroidetes bacterium]|nr:PLDc N-terminal domain-containing protein [Bacteroidota bacterium]
MFFDYPYIYYITIGLQVICAIHCIRKGSQYNWLWLIIFFPVVGCLIYIFSEMFTGNEMGRVQSGIGTVFNQSGSIRKLEEQLRFADTFKNKVALADALLNAGQTERAIGLYEECLKGNFTTHEHVIMQLIQAYATVNRFNDILPLAKEVYGLPQFSRSRAHTIYAIALSYTGHIDAAENEFKQLNGRFSNYESRYHYGQMMIRLRRTEEARRFYRDILSEYAHLEGVQKRNSKVWFGMVREALKKLDAPAV